MNIERGDIILAKLDPAQGSGQGKTRPCLVIQNNIANAYSPTTIIAPITGSFSDKQYPTEVIIVAGTSGLNKTSVVLCNQIRTIDIKERVIKKIGKLTVELMLQVNAAIKSSLDLD